MKKLESVWRNMSRGSEFLILILAAVALLVGIGALPASAAAPTNTFPGGAFFIDGQSHPIPANIGLWYRFDYNGGRTPILITMVNGTDSGLAFDVYTPLQVLRWWETPPIGRGTPQPLNCESMKPRTYGECKSRYLRWLGQFDAAGTYYVRVVNYTGFDLVTQLTIQGSGVTVGAQPPAVPPSPTAPTTPTAVPTPTPLPAPAEAGTNVDPGHAYVLDGLVHSIPGNSSRWFRFNYAGDRSEITVTLLHAANSGLAFNVLTPEEIKSWWNAKPIGRGTIEILNCETLQPAPYGQCQSDYLSWNGKFNAPGAYYVELINYNPTVMTIQFTIVGTGVQSS